MAIPIIATIIPMIFPAMSKPSGNLEEYAAITHPIIRTTNPITRSVTEIAMFSRATRVYTAPVILRTRSPSKT